jgi:hypothetical protein
MLREQTFSLRTTAREQIIIITAEVQNALASLTRWDTPFIEPRSGDIFKCGSKATFEMSPLRGWI